MTACPNSTAGGCRCPEHAPGLYATAAKATRLHAVPIQTTVCHGYPNGCICTACAERALRGGQAPPPTLPIRQPWDPRPARHAA